MNELHLSLLLHDIAVIGNGLYINDYFTSVFNDFILENYKDNKELFSLIFNIKLLETISNKNKYQILSQEKLLELALPYNSLDKCLELIDEVGLEIDSKLNQLALLFVDYYYVQYSSLVHIETPYVKVLQ